MWIILHTLWVVSSWSIKFQCARVILPSSWPLRSRPPWVSPIGNDHLAGQWFAMSETCDHEGNGWGRPWSPEQTQMEGIQELPLISLMPSGVLSIPGLSGHWNQRNGLCPLLFQSLGLLQWEMGGDRAVWYLQDLASRLEFLLRHLLIRDLGEIRVSFPYQ